MQKFKLVYIKTTFSIFSCLLFACNQNEKLVPLKKITSKSSSMYSKVFSNLDAIYSKKDLKNYVGYFKENLELNSKRINNLLKIKSKGIINKEFVSGDENNIQYFSKYIGDLEFKKRKLSLFLEIFTVQAAIEKHGHSEIVLFNGKKGMVYSEFALPKEYNVCIANDQLLLSNKKKLQKFDLTQLSDDLIIFEESK